MSHFWGFMRGDSRDQTIILHWRQTEVLSENNILWLTTTPLSLDPAEIRDPKGHHNLNI